MLMKSVVVSCLLLLVSVPAMAQDGNFDVAFGYAAANNSGLTGNGWWLSGEKKISPRVGIVADVSGQYFSESVTLLGVTSEAKATGYSFRVGPRVWFPLQDYERVKPFADLMLGGYHTSVSSSVTGGFLPPEFQLDISDGKTGVAFGIGGGADFRLGESISARVKPEWGSGVSGFALLMGLVLHLGD